MAFVSAGKRYAKLLPDPVGAINRMFSLFNACKADAD
jgi:hypothetical protein